MADTPATLVTKILGSVQQEVESLMQGVQVTDPRLYDAILLLNSQLERIGQTLSPIVRKSQLVDKGITEILAPTGFICFSTGITVRFAWNEVASANTYEVRRGTVWDTAFLEFRTVGLQGDIDPLKYGSYDFLIKSLDVAGNYSNNYEHVTFTVPHIAAPGITLSIIDNNVLLYWTEPASIFKIDHYLVDKHGDSEAAGRVDGTFTSIFEVVAGTYEYVVSAVDIAGNIGDEASVTAEVNQPPDFALQDVRTSGLNGTRVNVLRLPVRPSLVACWQSPQSWQEHFQVFNNWLNIDSQIKAGYPIYIQPSYLNGSYEEVIDYGLSIQNTIVTINWSTIFYLPQFSVDIIVKMAVSDDNITYTPFTSGASQYFRQLRYLKFRLEFAAENDKVFIELYNLTTQLNVKRENDGGEAYANSADVGGTVIFFTKQFKDIESITATTKSPLEPFTVIFDFLDVPNPVSFKVFVFDSSGNRVSRLIDWKARGIV